MSKEKYIVATSGGFVTTKRWGVMRPGATFLKALKLTKKDRPKVCFMMTATGDDASYIARSYEAMSDLSVDVTSENGGVISGRASFILYSLINSQLSVLTPKR